MNRETLYVDASAAVKLYVSEAGGELADEAIRHAGALISSRILYAEVGASLQRRLDAFQADDAVAMWERLWTDFDVVEVDAKITSHALALARFHKLGTLDAIHLASALRVPAVPMRFITWDGALARAAQAVGLRTIPDPGVDARRPLGEEEATIVATADEEAGLAALARRAD